MKNKRQTHSTGQFTENSVYADSGWKNYRLLKKILQVERQAREVAELECRRLQKLLNEMRWQTDDSAKNGALDSVEGVVAGRDSAPTQAN